MYGAPPVVRLTMQSERFLDELQNRQECLWALIRFTSFRIASMQMDDGGARI
jgi:hypothetical protein